MKMIIVVAITIKLHIEQEFAMFLVDVLGGGWGEEEVEACNLGRRPTKGK
jgi:hypothetical protein